MRDEQQYRPTATNVLEDGPVAYWGGLYGQPWTPITSLTMASAGGFRAPRPRSPGRPPTGRGLVVVRRPTSPEDAADVENADVGGAVPDFLSLEQEFGDLVARNRSSDGPGMVVVASPRRRSGVRRPRQRPPSPDLPQFPPRPVAVAQRLSEVTNTLRDANGFTADDRRRGKQLSSEEMKKRSAANAFEHIVGERTNFQKFQSRLLVPAGSHNEFAVPAGSCTHACCMQTGPKWGTRLGCLSKFGDSDLEAVHNLFQYVRLDHVGDTERTQPRQRAFIDPVSGNRDMSDVPKRGVQAAPRDRLDSRLEDCVFYDAAVRGKDGKLGAYVFDFKLPSRSGVMIPVCENFFRTVLGYNRDDRQWRSALDRVKKAQVAKVQQTVSDIEAAEGGVVETDVPEVLDNEGVGSRGRITLAWFATFIKLYSVPMPMRKEVRIDFARKVHLYNFLKRHYIFASGKSSEVVSKYYFVGMSTFRGYMKDPAKYQVIRDAIAEKVGSATSAHGCWKLVLHDPSKKRDFKVCTTCSMLAETRSGAVAAADVEMFHRQAEYMDVHASVVKARRNQFMAHQRLSQDRPHQHLCLICDGMAHDVLDAPVLSRFARWSKDTDTKYSYPVHLVGALTWGRGGERTWCYFHDLLVQGGAANTCEVIVQTLEKLAANGELPDDPDIRVLHLQADNCGDNKNWQVIALCALLVRAGVFTKVELDFLHVGHTHEVIDQVFAVVGHWMRATDDDLSTLPNLMEAVKTLLNPYHCEEMSGCRDFATAFDHFQRGTLAGHSKPYSFRFEAGADDDVVDMAYQTSERLNGEWYSFPAWLKEDSLTAACASGSLDVPVLPLKLYSESKLVETKQVQRVGAAKGVMDSVTKDCFLHHINKLQELRAVVAPRSGQEYCVLSEQAAAYWRERVANVNDEDFLSLRLAAVPTEINLRAMYDADAAASTQGAVVVGRNMHNNYEVLERGQRDGVFRTSKRRELTCTFTEMTEGKRDTLNAIDDVQSNIVWRRILHEERRLDSTTAHPKVGELIAWVYPIRHGADAAPDDVPDPAALTVIALRAELNRRALDARGLKAALVERLQAAQQQQQAQAQAVPDVRAAADAAAGDVLDADHLEPDRAPMFLGVVVHVHVAGGDDPPPAVGIEGPVPHSAQLVEPPTHADAGTVHACHLLVMTYSPNQYSRARYSDMPRLPTQTFLEATFSPIVHPKRGPDDVRGEQTRMERHWLTLEDVVASTHTLGVPLVPLRVDPAVGVGLSGSPIQFPTDTKKNSHQRARLQSAITHHRCGLAGESCARQWPMLTGIEE